jgi:hypothetical protein
MPILPVVEFLSALVALLLAGAAFVNLSWAEGASSQAMKRQSSARTKRLFIAAGVFAAITAYCAYLCMR